MMQDKENIDIIQCHIKHEMKINQIYMNGSKRKKEKTLLGTSRGVIKIDEDHCFPYDKK